MTIIKLTWLMLAVVGITSRQDSVPCHQISDEVKDQIKSSSCTCGTGLIFDDEIESIPICQWSGGATLESDQQDEFELVIHTFWQTKRFEFLNYNFPAITKNAFKGKNITSLALRNVQIDVVLEGGAKTDGLENLKSLWIEKSNYIYGWKWSNLGQELPNLERIVIKNSGLFYADQELLNLAKTLRYLMLERCNLYWVQSIKNSGGLVWVNLGHNNLQRIPNGFISKLAKHLWYMDFSDNDLIELPKDFTLNIPKLRELRLNDNKKLKVIDATSLASAWTTLEELWLNDLDLDIPKDSVNPDSNNCWLLLKLEKDNAGVTPLYWYATFHKIKKLDEIKTICHGARVQR